MRPSRTLFVYFVRELSLYGGLGFLAISTLLVGQNVLRRVEEMAFIGIALLRHASRRWYE